jgi:hypothetical protein
MKRMALLCAVFVGAALTAVPAASADTGGHDVLTARLKLPVIFLNSTAACPQGIATYRLRALGTRGSGRNCLKTATPTACPSGSAAFLCQDVGVRMALRLPGGRIKGRARLHEIWTCVDAACSRIAIQQRWHGHVRRADGRLRRLARGSVSGGGTATVVASTFEVVRIHEVLVIRAHDDD